MLNGPGNLLNLGMLGAADPKAAAAAGATNRNSPGGAGAVDPYSKYYENLGPGGRKKLKYPGKASEVFGWWWMADANLPVLKTIEYQTTRGSTTNFKADCEQAGWDRVRL